MSGGVGGMSRSSLETWEVTRNHSRMCWRKRKDQDTEMGMTLTFLRIGKNPVAEGTRGEQ